MKNPVKIAYIGLYEDFKRLAEICGGTLNQVQRKIRLSYGTEIVYVRDWEPVAGFIFSDLITGPGFTVDDDLVNQIRTRIR